MPDEHAVNGYLSERDRHRKAALKALAGQLSFLISEPES